VQEHAQPRHVCTLGQLNCITCVHLPSTARIPLGRHQLVSSSTEALIGRGRTPGRLPRLSDYPWNAVANLQALYCNYSKYRVVFQSVIKQVIHLFTLFHPWAINKTCSGGPTHIAR
jgi:hypothetical protein